MRFANPTGTEKEQPQPTFDRVILDIAPAGEHGRHE
jgi:hypothetical protein